MCFCNSLQDGKTPLHLGIEKGVGRDIVLLLMKHGANLNSTDDKVLRTGEGGGLGHKVGAWWVHGGGCGDRVVGLRVGKCVTYIYIYIPTRTRPPGVRVYVRVCVDVCRCVRERVFVRMDLCVGICARAWECEPMRTYGCVGVCLGVCFVCAQTRV